MNLETGLEDYGKIAGDVAGTPACSAEVDKEDLSLQLPSVTSMTVTYNSGSFIEQHLASLASLEGLTATSVIDNQSPDDTFQRLKQFQRSNPNLDVALHQSLDNGGFGSANNFLARRLGTDFILIINPDVIIDDPLLLTKALQSFAEDDSVGIVGCRLTTADGSLDHACKRGEPTLVAALSYQTGLDRRIPFRMFGKYRALHVNEEETAPVDAVNGAFMLMRRSLFNEVNGFDERFWMYGEDLDLCRQVRELGYKVLYRGDIRATHLKGACSGDRRTPKANIAFYESMALYYKKWYGQWSPSTIIVSTLSKLNLAAGKRRRGR